MSHVYAASAAVALLLTLLIGGLAGAEDNPAGLLLHWRFAEPGGLGVYSRPPMVPISGFTVGGAQRILDPQRGPTMQCNGVDALVSAGSASQYANVGTGSFSILLWVRNATPSATSAYLMKDNVTGVGDGFYFYSFTSSTNWWTGIEELALGATVPSWTHVAVTRAAGTNALTGYYNGVATVSGTDSRSYSNSTALTVCAAPDTFYPFQGRLASVRIYARALGPAEILRVYQQELLPPAPPSLTDLAALLLPGGVVGAKGSFFHLFSPQ